MPFGISYPFFCFCFRSGCSLSGPVPSDQVRIQNRQGPEQIESRYGFLSVPALDMVSFV